MREKKTVGWIKENYPKFGAFGDHRASYLYSKFQEEHKPEELLLGFLKTVSPEKTQEVVEMKYEGRVKVLQNKKPKGVSLLLQIESFTEDLKKTLFHTLEAFGWYPAMVAEVEEVERNKLIYSPYNPTLDEKLKGKRIFLDFEPKHDLETLPGVEKAYHITADIHLKKIQIFGLTPKTHSKLANHPGRIYLVEKFTEYFDAEDLAALLFTHSGRRDLIKEMVVLEIDMKKLQNHTFYVDPNFHPSNAIWTFDNISPSAIRVVERISMEGYI